MEILLKDKEAQDYIDYFHAIETAKKDSKGEVVSHDHFTTVVNENSTLLEKLLVLSEEVDKLTNLDIETYLNLTPEEEVDEMVDFHFISPNTYPENVTRTSPEYRHKWTDSDINTVEYCIHPTTPNSQRTLSYLASRLDPRLSEMGIRGKLNRLGISVKNGILHAN